MQAQTPTKRRNLLEGWQGGVVAISVAALGLMLGAPRAVHPTELPVPIARHQNLVLTHEMHLARGAAMATRSQEERVKRFDQRRVGEAIRRFGVADVARDAEALSTAKSELLAAVQALRVLPDGDDQLRELYGYHLRLFLRELGAWQATGTTSRDLEELAGSITDALVQNGWANKVRGLLPDVYVRAALFQKRFAEITGTRDVLGLNIDQHRALLAFLLSHSPPMDNPIALAAFRARRIEEVAQVDPDYPIELARAITKHQAGDFAGAVEGYRKHFALHPDGPYTLRARNYLKALESP